MLYTIIIISENSPGVLYRITNLFLRRKINIDSLTVSETETKNKARFTIAVNTDNVTIEKIVKQLYRIIEIEKVMEKTDNQLVFREIALIKVFAKGLTQKQEIEQIVNLSQASIIVLEKNGFVIEKTGPEKDIDQLINLLKPYGIKELVRSGRIALRL